MPRRFSAAKSRLIGATAAAFSLACIASAVLNAASAFASVGLTGMCATTDGGALMRVGSPSADTTASLQIYGDASSKVSAFAKAGTNTYVFVPKATFDGGQKTITMTTSPDVGSSVKVSNKSLCSQTLTVTSSLTDPLHLATQGMRVVTVTGTGAVSNFTTTLSVPTGGSASISLPATVADGSTSATPAGGYVFNLKASDVAGALAVGMSPTSVTSTYGSSRATSVLVETYRSVQLDLTSSSPAGVKAGEPVDFAVSAVGVADSASVSLKDGSTLLGTCAVVNQACAVKGVSFNQSGLHSIAATYSPSDGGSPVVSQPVSQLVTPAAAVAAVVTPVGATSKTHATVAFTLAEAGGTVECRLDSSSWAPCTTVDGVTASLVLDNLADGTHTASIRQADALGNLSPITTSDSWTVDTTAPAAPALSPNRPEATNMRSATITLTGEQGARFRCVLDAGFWVDCASPKSFAYLSLGRHTLVALQIDPAGNPSATASVSWVISQLTLTQHVALNVPAGAPLNSGARLSATALVYTGASSGGGHMSFRWQHCSSSSVLSCSDVATSESYVAAPADLGYRLRLVQTFTSSDGATVTSATAITGVVVPYFSGAASIGIPDSLAAPAHGRVLTVSGPSWHGFTDHPAAGQISYQWQRCSTADDHSCTKITGAKLATYAVGKYDVGKRLRALVAVTVGTGYGRTSVWAPTAISDVVTTTAKNTALPSVLLPGTTTRPTQGLQLNSQPGTWSFTWLGRFTYQWQACTDQDARACSDISGQTKPAFTPTAQVVGLRLRLVVAYTGHDGTVVSQASAITDPVAARSS